MADYRIGVFFTGREQLGEGAKTTAPVYYANRWDIQPISYTHLYSVSYMKYTTEGH